MAQQRYSEEAAREILKRATEVQLKESDFSDEHLHQMAQELGISEHALVLAKEQYLTEQTVASKPVVDEDDDLRELGITPEIRAQFEKHRRRDFYNHFSIYAVMSVFFLLIDIFSGSGWWFFWPMMGWGIGLAIHAVSTFVMVLDRDEYEEELIKWHTKRVKRRRRIKQVS